MRVFWLAAAVGLMLCPRANLAADRLILRDLTILSDRTVESCDEDGVRLDDGTLLTWDRVERGTVAATQQARFDQLLRELGLPLFRLRLRLKVGDDAGLVELAEALAPRFSGRSSASAYLVHRALMRGRLATGRRESAVEPYLLCLAYLWNQPEGRPEVPLEQRLAIDPQTGLCAELLAVWFDAAAAKEALPGVRQAAGRVAEPRPDGLRVYFATLALAAGDVETAERVAGGLAPTAGAANDWRETLQLSLEFHAASNSTAPSGASAWGPVAQRLEARAATLHSSCRPVAYYWLGRAALQGDHPERRADAVLRLLTIPATYGAEYPELAAAALAHAAVGLQQMGDEAGSSAVRRELATRYGHTRFARSPEDGTPANALAPPTPPHKPD